MKNKILIIIFGIMLPFAACSQTTDRRISDDVRRALTAARITVPRQAETPEDFTLPYLNGTQFTLSQQKGKVIFLNFWATWCPPCRAEMPSMEALYQKFKDREFDIIAVNIQESNNDVSAFMRQLNLSFPVVMDSRGLVSGAYAVRSIPTSFIIDKRGLIVGRLVGSIDWNSPAVIAAFEVLLAE